MMPEDVFWIALGVALLAVAVSLKKRRDARLVGRLMEEMRELTASQSASEDKRRGTPDTRPVERERRSVSSGLTLN
jgi:hypothetical protein